MVLCLTLLLDVEVGWGSLWGRNKKGNAFYEKGQYDEALKLYRDAQLESPESPPIHYNIGNVLYQKKKFPEASEEYQKALSSDQPLLQEQAFYNLGNTAYRVGKLQEAIDFYKKALQLKSDDMDAKYNLEFVRKKLKEMAQKQPPQSQENQQKKSEEKEDKNQQKKSEEGQQPEEKRAEQQQEKKSEQPKEMKGAEGEKEGQKKPEPSPLQKGMMSKEEAERLLNVLKEQEKKNQKEVRKVKAKGRVRVEKDW